jgi:hypothetical protein
LYCEAATLAQTSCTICYCTQPITPAGLAVDTAGDIYIGGTAFNYHPETYPPPKKLSTVLTDVNVTIRELPPIIKHVQIKGTANVTMTDNVIQHERTWSIERRRPSLGA